jgi:hypothetical protein
MRARTSKTLFNATDNPAASLPPSALPPAASDKRAIINQRDRTDY